MAGRGGAFGRAALVACPGAAGIVPPRVGLPSSSLRFARVGLRASRVPVRALRRGGEDPARAPASRALPIQGALSTVSANGDFLGCPITHDLKMGGMIGWLSPGARGGPVPFAVRGVVALLRNAPPPERLGALIHTVDNFGENLWKTINTKAMERFPKSDPQSYAQVIHRVIHMHQDMRLLTEVCNCSILTEGP